VWWLDLDPTAGREQAGQRPALVVSSRFHLALTGGALISVLPMTTRERPGWDHRIRIAIPGRRDGYIITEQVRTVSHDRLTGSAASYRLTDQQIAAVRRVLVKMLDL
jgi:mRNA interferase MazF